MQVLVVVVGYMYASVCDMDQPFNHPPGFFLQIEPYPNYVCSSEHRTTNLLYSYSILKAYTLSFFVYPNRSVGIKILSAALYILLGEVGTKRFENI